MTRRDSWWERVVVPRIVRCGCGSEHIMELRREVVPLASGSVFELGCGGGLNQSFYDTGKVTAFSGIDPSSTLLDFARQEAAKKGWQADIREGVGEEIPFAAASFDTVVCTYTLCSVNDPARVLAEVKRVLKPGGQLLFLEHGRSPDPGIARWQERIDPLWSRLFGNCHLSRPVGTSIGGAGLSVEPMGEQYMDGPRFVSWMEWGRAIRRD
ncbi:class I SAM-dependent methyltransferase [Novosphingobium sp. TH158]|uniref:class I SAM-dependent methyltransferase n=1 Tax=Novosphingobium sp. TH158 TaxID=2067455 RepID=UPI000C7CAB6A|nr:class I SAM-dependent methyltransferase [Novosphingobium sp. TH158]PLK25783.1 SAM-dependent methyltransferase [Novosphingobium sp. TH158]